MSIDKAVIESALEQEIHEAILLYQKLICDANTAQKALLSHSEGRCALDFAQDVEWQRFLVDCLGVLDRLRSQRVYLADMIGKLGYVPVPANLSAEIQ